MATLFLIGRIMLGIYVLVAAYSHISGHKHLTGYAASKHVPFPGVSVALSTILLILSGLSIISGIYLGIGLWLFVLFLIPVTFMMHRFWEEADPMSRMNNRINFEKNLALVGLTFMLIAFIM